MKKKKLKIVGISLTLLLAVALITMSILYLNPYGRIVFCLISVLIGFMPPFIAGRKIPMTKKECYHLSFITLVLALLFILVLTFEGMIRIVMVFPLTLPIVWLFSYIAFRVNDKRVFKVKDFFRVLPLFIMLSMSFDYHNDSKERPPVKTDVGIPIYTQSI